MDKGNKFVTNKIWKKTLKNLRVLSALEGKPMVKIIDELIAQRLRYVQDMEKENG